MFDKILFGTIASGRPLAPLAPPVAGEYLYAIASWTGETANQLGILDASSNTLVSMTGLLVSNSYSLAVHPDGTYIAVTTASAPYVVVYDTADWSSVVLSGLSATGTVTQSEILFTPDGSLLVAATTSGLRVIRTSDWTQIAAPNIGTTFLSLAVSPDSSTVVASSSSSPRLFVFSTSDWSVLAGTPNPGANAYGMAFNASGDRMLYGKTSSDILEYNTANWAAATVSSSSVFGGKYAVYSNSGDHILAGVQNPPNLLRKYDALSRLPVESREFPNPNPFRLAVPTVANYVAIALNSSSGNPSLVVVDVDTMDVVPMVGAATSSFVRAIAYGKWASPP